MAQFDPYSLSQSYPSHPVGASSTKHLPFPPPDLDSLSPAGIFVGVFSVDSSFERRMLVRTSWATHPRSRNGAGEGDGGVGTSRTIVRFVMGQPRKDWERRIKLEMEMFNDIVILPIAENMNRGKTHTFFSWAAINAWVPPVYNTSLSPPLFSYSNHTTSPPPLTPHDSSLAWQDHDTGAPQSWVRPDYVVKVDDDSFVMLAELEARLRVELHTKVESNHGKMPEPLSMLRTPATGSSNITTVKLSAAEDNPESSLSSSEDGPLIYWGYLVTNRLHKFMAGELYALSWNLVDWVAKDPAVKGVTRGAEDKQTAKWMRLHPRSSEVRWVRSPLTPDYAWTHREGRRTHYEGKRVGGTVVVHFIKKNIWYLETALALLDGEEQSEFEKSQSQESESNLERTPRSDTTHRAVSTQS
ncbi:hypothetical protein C0992_001966 [Termitomyces sp. T32_za158]|nr:hypothetical protein C0992_001966 [Termitomyces sp. T32_za158]